MPGVRVDVACAKCGKPMGALTQTITAMRTKGMPLLCANCRDERDRVAMRRYKRAMYTTWKKEREG